MELRFSKSQPIATHIGASTKGLCAVCLVVLIALSSSLVSPIAATQAALVLPSVPVSIEVFNGTQSYFNITLSGVPAGYDVSNGKYLGWCVDRTANMTYSPTKHQVRLYSTDNPPGDLAGQNWTMVNYILNHKQGNSLDIQEAIWYFVNLGTGYSPSSSVAWTIVNDTLANGYGFVPRPGQIISVICLPLVIFPGGPDVQVTVIELTVPLIGDVTGPNGQPDGRVNMRDIGLIARHFGETVPPAPSILDLDSSGTIDMNDISLVAAHFGEHYL